MVAGGNGLLFPWACFRMKEHLMQRWISILALVFVAIPTASLMGQPASESYFGEVIGRDVYVRSGPSATSYHCIQISSPTRVTVIGQKDTWLKILPPAGCYSVIARDSVKADANARSGEVAGADPVRVFVGGHPGEPGNFSMLQKVMQPKQRVRILGVIGDYYKIDPPRGSYFWIAAEHVRRLGAAAATSEPTASRPVKKTPSDAPSPEMKKIQALEAEVLAESKKPVEKRDYRPVLAKFRKLTVSKESGLQPYLAARIESLELAIERGKDEVLVQELTKRSAAEHKAFRAQQAKIKVAAASTQVFDAKGIVAISRVYPGNAAIGKRLALRDMKALRVVAYLRSASGAKLEGYVGKNVGVYGRRRYDASLGLDVIDVQKVSTLDNQAAEPNVPKAVFRPAPVKPTTKPAVKPVKKK